MKIKRFFMLLSFFCFGFPVFESRAFSITHDIDAFVGPFNAGLTTFAYGLDKSSYFVESTVRTSGLFGTLYPFEADYATSGRIKGRELETSSYKYRTKSLFNTRTKELVYGKDGQPLYALTSKNEKVKRRDIKPDKENLGTTDLQTVFAEMASRYNKTKSCDSTMEVFDGKRRFKVIFQNEGFENLEQSRDKKLAYEGKARKCSMYINDMNDGYDDLLWKNTSERAVYFWILESTNAHPFIVKIEIEDSPLGRILAYTKKISVDE